MRSLPFLFLLVIAAAAAPAPLDRGDPSEHLPPHITRLLWFGERPDWRHDGKRVVFLGKVFGEVYEYEIATGRIFPCSDHFKHHGFTRAMYLSNGDLLLSGPRAGFDRLDKNARENARINDSYLSVLDRSFTQPPLALGVHCNEGPAVSRTRLRIAWTHDGQTAISVGDIVYEGGVPELAHVKRVLDLSSFPPDRRPRRFIETQSFVPPADRALTITAYEINDTASTEVFLADLDTGALRNISMAADHYNEAEGIFPDGKHTTIERAPHTETLADGRYL